MDAQDEDSISKSNKRKSLELSDQDAQIAISKPRLLPPKDIKLKNKKVIKERWRINRMNEDYVGLTGNIMNPKHIIGPYGYDSEKAKFPFDRVSSLAFLLSPLRRPTIMEKWNPYEISVFEASLALHGKNFNQVQKFVYTKSVKEVIEFYYTWKMTGHYKQWKEIYKKDEKDAAIIAEAETETES